MDGGQDPQESEGVWFFFQNGARLVRCKIEKHSGKPVYPLVVSWCNSEWFHGAGSKSSVYVLVHICVVCKYVEFRMYYTLPSPTSSLIYCGLTLTIHDHFCLLSFGKFVISSISFNHLHPVGWPQFQRKNQPWRFSFCQTSRSK